MRLRGVPRRAFWEAKTALSNEKPNERIATGQPHPVGSPFVRLHRTHLLALPASPSVENTVVGTLKETELRGLLRESHHSSGERERVWAICCSHWTATPT